MTRTMLTIGLFIACSAGPLRADIIYLAIGDSSAFGETNRSTPTSNGDRGYVAPFADALALRYGERPRVLNFGINGETTQSYFSGTGRVSSDGQSRNTNYLGFPDPYPQYQRALNAALAEVAAGNRIGTITLTLGANNLDAVATPALLGLSAAEQQAVIFGALMQVQSDYVNILGDLRTRFPEADIFTMGYHNPYNGDPSHPFFGLADPAVRGLNQILEGVTGAVGLSGPFPGRTQFVDVYSAIHPNEGSLSLIGTWQTDPVNYVHLNDRGYQVAGNQLISTAAVPAPPGVILALFGGVLVIGRQFGRRRPAAA